MKTSTTCALIVACLALAATGCGSTDKGGPANQSGGTGAQGEGPGGGGQGRAGGPGGSGKVAAVSGSTAQVQNQGGQVAVTWTARTTFTQEVDTKASALGVGDCVMVMPARSSASGSDDGSAGSTDGPVAAATVRIMAPVGGSCSPVMRAGGGPRDGTAPLGTPGPPQGAAPGAPDQDQKAGDPRRFMSGAFGKVTAVTGSGFTVDSAAPSGSSATPAPTSRPTQVTTSADTVWTASRKATAEAVAVGRCVTSIGRADSTGAIAAASITVSSPVNGECSTGFPGGGPPPGGGQGGGPATDDGRTS